ncbi:hypothetical protein K438DRAFT_1977277 [Mycena galopus ATCC 62051]|nr:hypothetical protein K438DRAFT_1977277 [Mycena galopus ATCC 62051]
MFSKVSIVVAYVLTTLAAATPTGTPPPPVTPPSSRQCCDHVVSSTSAEATAIAALLGIDLDGLNVPIGVSCSDFSPVPNVCASTTFTCDAPPVEWGGLIAINCFPITS